MKPYILFVNVIAQTARVIKPKPPISMRQSITICPKSDQYVAVSCTTSPVTHVAEVDVNSASSNDVWIPSLEEMGSVRINAPKNIIAI